MLLVVIDVRFTVRFCGTFSVGIATQTVVEQRLIAQTGKRRKDFTREEFLSRSGFP